MLPFLASPIHDGNLHVGLYPATVKALAGDPEGRGRIEVALDWLAATDGGDPPLAWATIVTPYADADQGFQMLPEIGSTVVVAFQAGHLDHPYVIGSVWNGNASPPVPFDDANDLRVIQTRSGSRLEFDDTPGAASVTVSTPGGHSITMDDGSMNVKILASNGVTIELTAAGGVTISANVSVDVTAPMVSVDAALSEFSGIVMCDTLIATGTGVISPSYTPGAGNVW